MWLAIESLTVLNVNPCTFNFEAMPERCDGKNYLTIAKMNIS